jgi:DNA-binding transcriptional ArsR family regulator
MSNEKNPYESIKQIFHEPNRLAIMSALCAAETDGMTFNELKKECGLTDGNLSRHLNALKSIDVIRIEKKFVGVKPCTTVFISENGYEKFNEYLTALSEVLEQAQKALPKNVKTKDSHLINGLRAGI